MLCRNTTSLVNWEIYYRVVKAIFVQPMDMALEHADHSEEGVACSIDNFVLSQSKHIWEASYQ